MARRFGKPLMPWQQYVADVALEIDPDTGGFAYNEVGLTVPRQSGKSTLILAKATHRCTATGFFGPRQRVVYTAQTRQKAREKWREDYVIDLEQSRTFAPLIAPYYGGGEEHIRFQNGSRFGIESNTEKAGHGGTIDEAYVDEAFAQPDGRLEQAFRPAMITRANTQLWWVSTAGWSGESAWLEMKVERGRSAADMGFRDGLAYFEWSAPEDADPDDQDVWRSCMPAMGHTIDERKIEAELRAMESNIADFRRAFLNQWVPKDAAEDMPVDMERWESLARKEDQHPSPVAFAVEVSPDREWSGVYLAGRRSDGSVWVQRVDSQRGTGWVLDRVAELAAKWSPVGVALRHGAPALSLRSALAERGIEAVVVGQTDMGAACGRFVDLVNAGGIAHGGSELLSRSLRNARKRRQGESWQWAPAGSVDVSPLQGVTAALFVLEREASRPKTRSGVVI